MIRYEVPRAELIRLIDEKTPTWRTRAADRIAEFESVGRYDGTKSSFWSEVTPVLRELQHNKCAYCERRLAGPPFGAVEFDLEHFRPKSEVKAWPSDKIRKERGIDYGFDTGAEGSGYYRLSYLPFNYAATCKTCNSPLKSSYFPVAGPRRPDARDPEDCAAEKAFLPFPLGPAADDPSKLLTFIGILPVPRAKSGEKYRRAQVTIDFFALDTREELLRERAFILLAVAGALAHPEDTALSLQRKIVLRESSPHSSCAAAFDALWKRDRQEAMLRRDEAVAYLESHS